MDRALPITNTIYRRNLYVFDEKQRIIAHDLNLVERQNKPPKSPHSASHRRYKQRRYLKVNQNVRY